MLGVGHGEGVMSKGPSFRVVVPFKHRKVRDPGKVQRIRVGQLQALGDLAAQQVQRFGDNLRRVGDEADEVAGLGFGESH